MKNLLIIFLPFILVSCGESSDSRYDSGFSDGYAAGYNTTCGLRATMIEGDWSDSNYTKGYNNGYSDGSKDCKKSK